MTDPRGSHMGGAVRDGRQPLPEWRFVCEERRRPDAELLTRLDAEDVADDESARYLVEIRIGRRKPVSGPGRPTPAVQAVYCDERAERWCYRRPAAEVDSESDLGVALVEDVEDCISSVIAADPSFGGSPPPGLPPERLRDQAREVLREAHRLDVPEVRTDGGRERECGHCHSTNIEICDETNGIEVRYLDYWCNDCERPGTWRRPRGEQRRGSA